MVPTLYTQSCLAPSLSKPWFIAQKDRISYLPGWLSSKAWQIASVSEDGEKLWPSCIASGKVKSCSWGNSLVVLQKAQCRITIWPSHSTSRYMPQRTKSRDSSRYLYITVRRTIIPDCQNVETTQVSIDR